MRGVGRGGRDKPIAAIQGPRRPGHAYRFARRAQKNDLKTGTLSRHAGTAAIGPTAAAAVLSSAGLRTLCNDAVPGRRRFIAGRVAHEAPPTRDQPLRSHGEGSVEARRAKMEGIESRTRAAHPLFIRVAGPECASGAAVDCSAADPSLSPAVPLRCAALRGCCAAQSQARGFSLARAPTRPPSLSLAPLPPSPPISSSPSHPIPSHPIPILSCPLPSFHRAAHHLQPSKTRLRPSSPSRDQPAPSLPRSATVVPSRMSDPLHLCAAKLTRLHWPPPTGPVVLLLNLTYTPARLPHCDKSPPPKTPIRPPARQPSFFASLTSPPQIPPSRRRSPSDPRRTLSTSELSAPATYRCPPVLRRSGLAAVAARCSRSTTTRAPEAFFS